MKINIIILFILCGFLSSVKSHAIGSGQLKILLVSNEDLYGAELTLCNEHGIQITTTRLSGDARFVYFSNIPNGWYTLKISHPIGAGTYRVYVESNELSTAVCPFYHVSCMCPNPSGDESILGSCYGNTSTYRLNSVLRTP